MRKKEVLVKDIITFSYRNKRINEKIGKSGNDRLEDF